MAKKRQTSAVDQLYDMTFGEGSSKENVGNSAVDKLYLETQAAKQKEKLNAQAAADQINKKWQTRQKQYENAIVGYRGDGTPYFDPKKSVGLPIYDNREGSQPGNAFYKQALDEAMAAETTAPAAQTPTPTAQAPTPAATAPVQNQYQALLNEAAAPVPSAAPAPAVTAAPTTAAPVQSSKTISVAEQRAAQNIQSRVDDIQRQMDTIKRENIRTGSTTEKRAASQLYQQLSAERDELKKQLSENYGVQQKTDWNKLAYGAMLKGADQFASGITSSLNFLLGEPAQIIQDLAEQTVNDVLSIWGKEVDFGDNLISRWNQRVQAGKAQNEEFFAANAGFSRAAQIADEYGTATVAAVPMAVETVMFSVATLPEMAGQASTAALNYASTLAQSGKLGQLSAMAKQGLKALASDPNYWTSYLQVVGDSYDSAIEQGMDSDTATMYALTNSAINAAIEIGGADEGGGGLQSYLSKRGMGEGTTGGKIFEWIKSAWEEGGEEVKQGIVERMLMLLMSGKEITADDVVSLENSDAVFNPQTLGKEWLGGAVVGGVLGAPNLALDLTMGNSVQHPTASGETLGTDTQQSETAQKISDDVDSVVEELAKETDSSAATPEEAAKQKAAMEAAAEKVKAQMQAEAAAEQTPYQTALDNARENVIEPRENVIEPRENVIEPRENVIEPRENVMPADNIAAETENVEGEEPQGLQLGSTFETQEETANAPQTAFETRFNPETNETTIVEYDTRTGEVINERTETAENPLSDSGRGRGAGERTERPRKTVVRSSEDTRAHQQLRAATTRQNDVTREKVSYVSTSSLGITTGTDSEIVRVYDKKLWDKELTDTANRITERTGKEVVYVVGRLQVKTADGEERLVNGVSTPEKIIIQCDDMRYSAGQLGGHESFHSLMEDKPKLLEKITEEVKAKHAETWQRLVNTYMGRLRGVYVETEGNEDFNEDIAQAQNIIAEEILADAYGDMNKFSAGATELTDTVRGMVSRETGVYENEWDALYARAEGQSTAYAEETEPAAAEPPTMPEETAAEPVTAQEQETAAEETAQETAAEEPVQETASTEAEPETTEEPKTMTLPEVKTPEIKTTTSENGYTIRDNPEYGSIEISFDGKPGAEVRTVLKENKFRWNKKKSVWYGRAGHEEIMQKLDAAYDKAANAEPENVSLKSAAETEPKAEEKKPKPFFDDSIINQKAVEEIAEDIAEGKENPTADIIEKMPTAEAETETATAEETAEPQKISLPETETETAEEPTAETTEDTAEPEEMKPVELPTIEQEENENERPKRQRARNRSDGEGTARSLEEEPAEAVQRAGEERGTLADTGERRAEDGRGDNRDDAERNERGSGEGSSESGDLRDGVSEEPQTLREETEQAVQQKSTEQPKGSNYVIGEKLDVPTTPKTRYKANVEAIRIIKQLQAEGRYATAEEQSILAQYTGWGGVTDAFDSKKSDWAKEYSELKELLTEDEYRAANASILNAYYTSTDVIKGMYAGLEKLGFKGGRMMEPSSGTGNFVGAMPTSMSGKARWTMVELDEISGQIAKYLYPQADVRIQGFEKANIPNNYIDVAIGNVPFGNIAVVDKAYPKSVKSAIHNYFFAKTLDKVRPGGIVMFITSHYTMDSRDAGVRNYIADRADLLGAIRLPNTAFEGTGTPVTSDILILQKRAPNTVYGGAEFANGNEWLNVNGNYAQVNEYFIEHPEMVLGEHAYTNGRWGGELTVNPRADAGSLQEQIAKAFENISGKMEYTTTTPEQANINAQRAEGRAARDGALTEQNGKIYETRNGELHEVKLAEKEAKRIKGLLSIRGIANTLLNAQVQGDTALAAEQRAKLNEAYDKFVAEHGAINAPANRKALKDDPYKFSLFALEKYDPDTKKAEKTDVFVKDTVSPNVTEKTADSVADALVISRNRRGGVDVDYMAQLTGRSTEEVSRELIEGRLAFKDRNGDLVAAEEYLSGNVRAKLRDAEALKEADKDYEYNIEALKTVVPKDVEYSEIYVAPGAPWVPDSVYSDFAAHILGTSNNYRQSVKVTRNVTGGFTIEYLNKYLKSSVENSQKWGTAARSFEKIFDAMLNSRSITVTYKDSEGKTHVDADATAAANEKVEEITKEFQKWLWEDEERKADLQYLYNETFNAFATAKYDGSNLTVNGANATKPLRPHQKNAVQRIISSGGNTLLAHRVGAGKTYEMAAAAMKLKELGIVKKPMFAVPKSLVAQWGNEFNDYFPGAKLLVAEQNDFTSGNRKVFTNRIANGDYDAVIVSYEQFEKIPMSDEFTKKLYQEQIDEITAAIDSEKRAGNGKGLSVRDMESKKKQLENKIAKLTQKSKDADNIDFEQLGIDSLFVDEAHNFKNLFYTTSMNNVSGLGNKNGSQRAFDLYTKTRYLQQLNGGRGIVFATATPVMNSMSEMYIMQRYLQPDLLKQLGIDSFDAWAKQFGEVVNALEVNPTGTGYRMKQSFSHFKNMGELQQLFRSMADVLTEVPGLKIPKMKGGKVNIVVCEPSEFQLSYMKEIEKRAENVKNVDPSVDNMLKITSDGRKISYTQRMIDPSLPYEEGGKIYRCADNVVETYNKSGDIKGTQLIFLDSATPKGKAKTETEVSTEENYEAESAQLYDDLRARLIKKGIPAKEIAFIHDADTDAKKKKLFADVNEGKVRVLIGSTGKMGVGMNAQRRVVAIHHLDAPWRPGDIEQRNGRAFRQGNINDEVECFTYVTEQTFDSRLWDIIDRKQRFIDDVMNGENVGRDVEDTGEITLSAAEVKALASGSPEIKEAIQLENEIKKLDSLYKAHNSETLRARAKMRDAQANAAALETRVRNGAEDVKKAAKYKQFSLTIGNSTYSEKADAGAALIEATSNLSEDSYTTVGSFAGFELRAIKTNEGAKGLLYGNQGYPFKIYPGNPKFGITQIEKLVLNMGTEYNAAKNQLEMERHNIGELEKLANEPFAKEEQLQQKRRRYKELMDKLNPPTEQQLESAETESGEKYSVAEEENEYMTAAEQGDGETTGSAVVEQEVEAKDISILADGTPVVRINTRESSLFNEKNKGKWGSIIADLIRSNLAGKAIIAADGDVIRITDRAAGEVAYGSNVKGMIETAKEAGDYSDVNRKWFTAEHAAAIIALSRYSSWSKNVEDPTDMFKKDGLNKRSVELVINGKRYTATVITALNDDINQSADYGEKFYDIIDIKENQTQMSANYETAAKAVASSYRKIKYADMTSDILTLSQKQRIVNNRDRGIAFNSKEDASTIPEWKRELMSFSTSESNDKYSLSEEDDEEPETISLPSVEDKEKENIRQAMEDYGKKKTEKDPVRNRLQHVKLPGLDEDTDVNDYIRDAEKRAEAAKKERVRTIPKAEFEGTANLDKLGVKISGSVGRYGQIDQLKASHEAAKAVKKETAKIERMLKPTAAEKNFAAGIAAGIYYEADIPYTMNHDKVSELADYYWAEQSVSSDMIRDQRKQIKEALDEKMDDMLRDAELLHEPKAFELNTNTPDRNLRRMYGDKVGQQIYDDVFAPVAANEAEKFRFTNRMYDDVRKFKGRDGKESELNKQERAATQAVMEEKSWLEAYLTNEKKWSGEISDELLNAADDIGAGMNWEQAARKNGVEDADKKLLDGFKKWADKIDKVKVENAAKKYAANFNEFYAAINDVLIAHGYDPIGFRQNYAPHTQPEAVQSQFAKAAEMLGLTSEVNNLPTSIAGLTASYKPNKRWNPHFLERTGDKTKFDIAENYENYVEYLADVIYHVDDIMRVRAMSNWMRQTYAPENIRDTIEQAKNLREADVSNKVEFLRDQGVIDKNSVLSDAAADEAMEQHVSKMFENLEKITQNSNFVMWLDNYANLLAAKQMFADRGIEQMLGRRALNVANKLTKLFGMSQVGGKFSSALNQTAQLPMITAELGTKYTAAAFKDFATGKLRRAAWSQESDFLTGKAGVDYIVTDTASMVTTWLFKPAEFMDTMMSTIAVRGRYLKEIDKGASVEEAIKAADKFGNEIMGSRMKGTKPLIFESKNPLYRIMGMFQVEALNTWQHVKQDLPRDFREIESERGKEAAARALAGVIFKTLLASFLLNRLWDELYGGSPAPFDFFGTTANFIASGQSLTTNKYLAVLIDNALENIGLERALGTTEKDKAKLHDGEFDLKSAMEDTEYNILNDIPFVRNVSGMLGLGDSSLPMAGFNGGIQGIKEAVEEMYDGTNSKEVKNLMKAIGSFITEFIPAGSQITRTMKGLNVIANGGKRNSKGNIQYAVDTDIGTIIRAMMFGAYSLPENEEYYSSGYSAFSDTQQRMYDIITGTGVSNTDAYDAIREAQDIRKQLKEEKGNDNFNQDDARTVLDQMDISNEMKAVIWQCFNKTWKGSSNPYDKSIGRQVYDALNDKKGEGIEGLSLPRLD